MMSEDLGTVEEETSYGAQTFIEKADAFAARVKEVADISERAQIEFNRVRSELKGLEALERFYRATGEAMSKAHNPDKIAEHGSLGESAADVLNEFTRHGPNEDAQS